MTLPIELRGDGPCTDCGTKNNVIWFTDSVFWNEICRQGEYTEPTLCIPCFVVRADRAGFYPTGWRLIPDWHWETYEERRERTRRTS